MKGSPLVVGCIYATLKGKERIRVCNGLVGWTKEVWVYFVDLTTGKVRVWRSWEGREGERRGIENGVDTELYKL